jgi:heme exporter protein A
MGTAHALLSARDLAGQRGERTLFQHLSFDLHAGQVIWLRGRNGRGKSTLLRILAGLSPPHAGTLAFNGTPLRDCGASWRADLCYIAHANALKDDLTAAEALSFLASLRGAPPGAADILDALTRLGIASRARMPVRTLSQGQRRRVALARLALPNPPRLWLLDEPFDALDDRGVTTLNTLLSEHAARGGATLLTSHQPLSLSKPMPSEIPLDDMAPRQTRPVGATGETDNPGIATPPRPAR